MLKQLTALGILAPLTLANLSSRVEAAGWAPLAGLMMGNHLSRAFDGGLRHSGGFYRPQFEPRHYGGFYRDGGGFYRDGGFYRGDGGFYGDAGLRRAPYPPGYYDPPGYPGYYGVADGGYAGCGSAGPWGGNGGYGGGYGGYDYDGYGW
jgi:hypothetical protein